MSPSFFGFRVQFSQDKHFHYRLTVFSSQLKSKVVHLLGKTTCLRINLNIDGPPIAPRSHTHPSHSQTSRLLSSCLKMYRMRVPSRSKPRLRVLFHLKNGDTSMVEDTSAPAAVDPRQHFPGSIVYNNEFKIVDGAQLQWSIQLTTHVRCGTKFSTKNS